MKKNLLLFDIDGTILRFKRYRSREIFACMIKDIFGKEVDNDLLPSFAGMTDLAILEEIAELVDIPFTEFECRLPEIWKRLISDFHKYMNKEYLELLPGVKKLLLYLEKKHEIQLGLLTGNFEKAAYLKLKTFGLDSLFPFGAFGSDRANRNELPSIAISRANKYLGNNAFSKKNTILIGDSPRDIECAKSNNIPIISVATGGFSVEELEELQPNSLVKDFSDLEVIKNMINNLSGGMK